MSAATATPYFIPEQPGRWGAFALGALVHLALFALLWFGVSWQNTVTMGEEAEVWDIKPREAAPRPQAIPTPPPAPIEKPLVKPPKAVEAPVKTPAPDIALEQEKKRKQEKLKAEEEKKREADAKRKKIEDDKALANKKTTDKANDKANKKKLADQQLAIEAAEQLARDHAREEEMRRISGVIGNGNANSSGSAPKSTGSRVDAGYLQKVGAKIKSNTVFNTPDDLAGNPMVEYAVDLLPDGSLRGVPRKLRSSGVPGFDEAVRRAIEKSTPFPPDKSGTVPSSIIVSHKPKD